MFVQTACPPAERKRPRAEPGGSKVKFVAGTVLILNGTSSAGKSTLLRAFQARMPDAPYLEAGLDKFLFMLPKPYLNDPTLWHQVMEPTQSGPVGWSLIQGMHRSMAALARAGNCVVADHVLIDPRWVQDCAAVLAPLCAYLIGVRCPLDVVEQRERDRKDRTLGQARMQYDVVHAGKVYDLEVDTARSSPEDCADQVIALVRSGAAPRALRTLAGTTGARST